MSTSFPHGKYSGERWADRDPALVEALEALRRADSRYQAQVALNIIKVIVEHKIESKAFCNIEDLVDELEQNGFE